MTFKEIQKIAVKQAENIPQIKALSEMVINAPTPAEAHRLLVEVFAIGFAQGWQRAERKYRVDDEP